MSTFHRNFNCVLYSYSSLLLAYSTYCLLLQSENRIFSSFHLCQVRVKLDDFVRNGEHLNETVSPIKNMHVCLLQDQRLVAGKERSKNCLIFLLKGHAQPVCFAHHCYCYYPGTRYFFSHTERKQQRIPLQQWLLPIFSMQNYK